MLVTFSCNAHGNIIMFGEQAVRLIKMMGHSGTVPSAILADNVPAALHQLSDAIVKAKNGANADVLPNETDAVSIGHRALPLIELLQDAVKHKCNVMWK